MSQLKTSAPDALTRLRIERPDARPRRSLGRRLLTLLIWLAVPTVLVVAAVALLVNRGALSLAEMIRQRPEVRVAVVEVQTGRSSEAVVVAAGYLESRQQAKIGAKAPGRIEAIHVDEGTRVAKGQTLAVLEHADLDAAIAATQATLERTKAELVEHEIQIQQYERQFQRAEKLLGTRGISESAHDEAKYLYEISVARRDTLAAAVDLAQARAREAEQMKENMFVRAPFDATVISKDAEVGESIMPGGMGEASGRGSVVTIADLDHLEVDTDVKEDYISRAQIGQPAEVAVDAVPGKRYQGRVRKIIPMGDRARATIKVKVEILDPDERLFPEMSSTVYFLPEAGTDEDSVSEPAQRKLFCPAAAVQADGEQRFVWVVDDQDQAHRTSVSLGARRDQQIEIATGLSGGERVIVNPPDDLQDGRPVKIAE